MEPLSWKRVLAIALMFAGGAALGAAMANIGIRALPDGPSVASLVALLLALPLLYMLIIAAHEAGHIIGGLLVDYWPLRFIVGPLRLEWTPEGVRAGLNRSISLSGGLAAMAPVGLHDLRRRALVMVSGGPVGSLMFGVQCLALWLATSDFLMGPDAGTFRRLAAGVLVFLGFGSLLIGIITLIPTRTGGFYSDGARLRRLLREDESAEQEVALLALTGLSLGGTRPRDWDPALVARCANIRDGSALEAAGQLYAYTHAADLGELARARPHLEAALKLADQLPTPARSSLQLHAATFFALFDGDIVRAAHHYRLGNRYIMLSAPHQRVLADAAVQLAGGNRDVAATAAGEALRLSPRCPDRGVAALDDDYARSILLNAATPPTPARTVRLA
jgi:hypothetical protein